MKINSLCEFAIPLYESFNLPPKKKKNLPPKKIFVSLSQQLKFAPRQTRVFNDINYLPWNLSSSSKTKSYFKDTIWISKKKKKEDTIWKEKISTFLNNFKMGYITKIVMVYKQAPKHWNFCFTRMFVWMENKENENEQVEEW